MKNNKKKQSQKEKEVYVLSKFATMKFTPAHCITKQKQVDETKKSNQNTIISKVKQYFSPNKVKQLKSPPKKRPSQQGSLQSSTIYQKTLTASNQISQSLSLLKTPSALEKPVTLKHIQKLTNDHFLIGDQDQLDVINLNCLMGDYIDSQFLWSINIGKKIELVAVDIKKSIFALITNESEIIIYQYLLKRNNEKPSKMTKFKIQLPLLSKNVPKYAQFSKEGLLVIFFQIFFDVYSVDGKLVQRQNRQYYPQIKNHIFRLFQIPSAVQNKINVFFQQDSKSQTTFSLWCFDIEFLPSGIKTSPMIKVYDVLLAFKDTLQIQNYSKDIYLLNLGFEIFAIKKGYVIDSANVNIQSHQSFLNYLGNQKLIHISKNRVDVYKFFIKQANPPKIQITSIDSMVLPDITSNFQFFKSMQMLISNIVLFYQLSPQSNSMVGEVRYKFCFTKKVGFQEKINMILPNQSQLQQLKSQLIQEKCDIAKKMGLTGKDIYLRIWNKSKKQSVADFKFLLSTNHYETIKDEIEKKLLKTSMSYRQLHTIQKVCFQMLAQNVYSSEFTSHNFKNFLISHFLLKKYELFLQFSKVDKKYNKNSRYHRNIDADASKQEQNKQIMISIQDYHKFSKADIKGTLLEYISEFCIEQKPQFIEKIRIILKKFKFSLRIDYFTLIQQAVKISHNNLIVLMKSLPQILPFKPQYSSQEVMSEEPQLFEGVWSEITNEDWQKNLYKQKIITVYNKQNLEQNFQSDVWYRRNWSTLHDCIFLSKKQIIQIHQRNKSDEIFYLIISKIYETINGQQKSKELLTYLQNFYSKVPNHLKNKIFLYKRLYDYFIEKGVTELQSLKDFLKLQDFQMFKLIFKYEKTFKNIIFTQIKPLYREICGDDQMFNEGLLNYFNSDESQISDIKYLLNRMNNKKLEFHLENQQTYEVLVKAIQSKIKIGSQDDTSIDQVLIYIQNIPLSPQNEIMEELHIIEQINEQADIFRKMKLNMSLYQIINNPDSVISAVIEFEIKRSRILELKSLGEIKSQTYRIIAQTQAIKQKIYLSQESDLTFFIYLTKVLENQNMINYARQLLQDKILAQYYTIDQMMIENLVLFMYKLKFSIDPVYVNNQKFINKLIELLPQQNMCRKFISNQVSLGVYLSPLKQPLWYPITGQENLISVFQIQSYINNLPSTMLPNMNAKLIWQKARILQEIASQGEVNNITLNNVYEFIILKLIQNFQLRQALKKIKQYFQQPECRTRPEYDFLYPAMILSKVYHEFCQQNRQAISLCCRYLYKDPKTLALLLQNLMTHKYSSQEQKAIIMEELENIERKKQLNIFCSNNLLFQNHFTQIFEKNASNSSNNQMNRNFNIIFIEILRRLLKLKDQFKTFQYHIIFSTICNNPYVLVKYVFLQRFHLNLKNFRCFLSYLIREEIFNKTSILQFGKRLFKMMHISLNQHKPIEEVIEQFKQIPLNLIQQIERIRNLQTQMDRKVAKSLERFKTKLKMVRNENKISKQLSMEQAKQKITKMAQTIKSPVNQLIQPFKYIFHDSDDDAENKEQQVQRQQINNKSVKTIFDAKLERTLLMSRRFGSGKPLNLYVSMDKPITTNMFFSQNFGIKGVQLNSLLKSKKFPTLKKSKDLIPNQKSINAFNSVIDKDLYTQGKQNQSQDSHDKNFNSEKKPKKKLAIAKAQSQYVNLDDFLKFQKLIRSVQKETTNKESQVPSINEIQVERVLRMSQKKLSMPETQGYLLADKKFSKIRKISEQIHDQMTEYPSQSNLTPENNQTEESVIQIQVAGQQNVQTSDDSSQNKQIIDQIFINQIVQQILKMIAENAQSTGKVQISSQILEKERKSQHFNEIIKIVIQKLYEQSKPITSILNIIKSLTQKYPQARVNKNYLTIYTKMAQLHNKFSLKFPFKKVFVAGGIYLDKHKSQELFSYLSPFLESYLDEENVLKIAKVLSLGFMKTQIQLQISMMLLKKFVKQATLLRSKIYTEHYVNLTRRKQDIEVFNFQLQKIQNYLEKVHVNLFIQRDKQIFSLLNLHEKQGKIKASQSSNSSDFKILRDFNLQIFKEMILQRLNKRGQNKIAEMLKNKWQKSDW